MTLRDDASYFREGPIRYEEDGTYADWDASVENAPAYEWHHSLGEVVTAFAQAGFRVETLREHPTTTYEAFGTVETDENDQYRVPGDPLPIIYALKASLDETCVE